MIFKIIGAVLIVTGCGCVGHIMTVTHKKTVALMNQLIGVLEFMECELSYRMSPLPELFRRVPEEGSAIQKYFSILADELESQISPDVACCVDAALAQVKDMPELIKKGILQFGRSVGYFDIDGQIKGIISVKDSCASMLATYTRDQETRLRNYQTLALCAGAAVVILLL